MQPETPSRRGRPPVMDRSERERQILDAAGAVFCQHGYAAAGMDLVAQACGMSRKTVYGLFGSKEQLFAALVTRAVPPDDTLPAVNAAGFEASVVDVMDQICARALAPRQIALLRLAIAETQLSPGLAYAYFENNVLRGRRFLTEQLRRLSQVFGRPEEEDFAQLSDMLFGAVVATPLIHALVGDEATHGPAETALRCRRLVAALLPERGQGDAKVGDDSFGL